MIRIHKNQVIPKYPIGLWSWNNAKDQINFNSWEGKIPEKKLTTSSSYKFRSSMNPIEEIIFRQEFARSTDFPDDGHIIRLEDIKNLVLFLAPSELITSKFISFIFCEPVDRLLTALIIYFEYYLRMVEFILIRRDEVSGENTAQIESPESIRIKRTYSEHLTQYRLVLAREYSQIVLGKGVMSKYYHLNTLIKMSKGDSDLILHEMLLGFATQVVWIAHHRKAFQTIDDEMNRLFRSPHFKLSCKESITFSPAEQELLYGINFKLVNYRRQCSPLTQELNFVSDHDYPILWVGLKKYRGNDLRLQQLEMEFICPGSDLCMLDIKHGIMGNPKTYYNTMLEVREDVVREHGYSLDYDPYYMIRQPYLEVSNLDAMKSIKKERLESYFYFKDHRYIYDEKTMKKWMSRDSIIEYMKSGGLVIDIVEKCKRELLAQKVIWSMATLTKAFKLRQEALRKHEFYNPKLT